MLRTPLLALLLALACGPKSGDSDTASTDASTSEVTDSSASTTSGATDSSASTSATSSATGSTGGSSSGTSTGPEPDYKRECQPQDFVCDDWGCDSAPSVQEGECYKPCTPDAGIGELDPECDEPERPFCSQVGQSFGGDFDCNGCVHVCIAEPLNQCQLPADGC